MDTKDKIHETLKEKNFEGVYNEQILSMVSEEASKYPQDFTINNLRTSRNTERSSLLEVLSDSKNESLGIKTPVNGTSRRKMQTKMAKKRTPLNSIKSVDMINSVKSKQLNMNSSEFFHNNENNLNGIFLEIGD